jgi:hypothetical protein
MCNNQIPSLSCENADSFGSTAISTASSIPASLGLNFDRHLPANIARCVGIWPAEEEDLTSAQKTREWGKAILANFFVASVAVFAMVVSFLFWRGLGYATLWLPNGVIIGCLCAQTSWRTRIPILPVYFVSNVSGVRSSSIGTEPAANNASP